MRKIWVNRAKIATMRSGGSQLTVSLNPVHSVTLKVKA